VFGAAACCNQGVTNSPETWDNGHHYHNDDHEVTHLSHGMNIGSAPTRSGRTRSGAASGPPWAQSPHCNWQLANRCRRLQPTVTEPYTCRQLPAGVSLIWPITACSCYLVSTQPHMRVRIQNQPRVQAASQVVCHHHHHQITRSSHSINAIGPAAGAGRFTGGMYAAQLCSASIYIDWPVLQ
jgi:hypothetical protein